jgi:hypothetical protein
LRNSTLCSHCNIVGHDKKDCGNKQSGLPRCKFCNIIGHSENEYYSNFKAKDKGNVADQSSNAVPESSYIAGLTLFDYRLLPQFGRNATHHFTEIDTEKCQGHSAMIRMDRRKGADEG